MVKYVITDGKRWIRKDSKGRYVPTNSGAMAAEFTKKQAEMIYKNSLSKPLKSCFHVEIWDDGKEKNVKSVDKKDVIDCPNDYFPSESVTRWVDKFGGCYDTFKEAKQRYIELEGLLRDSETDLLNFLHILELGKSLNMYDAWKLYTDMRSNRKKRRQYKDEMIVIWNVLREIDPISFSRERTQKAIDGLFGRKYRYRIVEVEDDEAV